MKNEPNEKFDTYVVALGKKLRQLRLSSGLPVAALSTQSGISTRNINRIEAGETDPTLSTLLKYSVAFGVTISELMKVE